MYRQKGDIERARKTINRIRDIDREGPDIRRLHAVLNQAPFAKLSQIRVEEDRPVPSPFFLLRDFLPNQLRDGLLRFAVDSQEAFATSQTVDGERPEIRQSKTITAQAFPELAEQVRDLARRALEEHSPVLTSEPVQEREIEIQLTAYGTGDHYLPHLDASGGSTASRRLTCVIHLFRTPKQFSGGDLLLYDGNSSGEGYWTGFPRIVPCDNSAILFRSDSWHQVAPISLASDRFADRRYCVAVWLHGAE